MEKIEWEQIPASEVKAEVEAALESSGQTRKIREMINDNEEVNEWRKNIEGLIKNVENIEGLTPDQIYDRIAEEARESMPQQILEMIQNKIYAFLENEFDAHQ